MKSSWGGAQFYDSNGEAVPDGQMLARAGKWLLVGVAGLVGIVVLLGVAGVGLQKLAFVSASAGADIKNIDQDALAYVGREPDAAFFKLPRVRAAFQKVMNSDDLVQFDEDEIRHLDFEKCQLEGRSILSVAWTGRISSGIDGSIAAIDLSNGRIVLASQDDQPGIDIRGDIQATKLSQLPNEVQRWIKQMKLQTAEQRGLSVEQIPVRFLMSAATSNVDGRNASAEEYLAMLHGDGGGHTYDPRAFLERPEIKAGLRKLFKKQPKLATPGGEVDVEFQFTYALYLPDEGFPKVVDGTLFLAGCTPHACQYGQSILAVHVATTTMQGAHFETTADGAGQITLYGIGDLQTAPAVVQDWVTAHKSNGSVNIRTVAQ